MILAISVAPPELRYMLGSIDDRSLHTESISGFHDAVKNRILFFTAS